MSAIITASIRVDKLPKEKFIKVVQETFNDDLPF